jgi:hypothetical protein
MVFFPGMNETSAPPNTTFVKAYRNPYTYKVHLDMTSQIGMQMDVDSNDTVKLHGRVINDPILDQFVGRMLSPELANRPVPITRFPVSMPRPAPPGGYVVGQGRKNKDGKWELPERPEPAPLPAATPEGRPVISNHPSVKGMTMEEARRMGFIGKQRLVPEDYGANETTGTPTRGDAIPTIKYSVEAPAPRAKASGLPAPLTEGVPPEMAPIIQQMAAADSGATDLETADLSTQAAEGAARRQLGEKGAAAFQQSVQEIRQAAPAPPAPVKIVATPTPVRRVAEALPSPALPEPAVQDKMVRRYVCPVRGCGEVFPYRSWYVEHLRRFHRKVKSKLMPPPSDPGEPEDPPLPDELKGPIRS